MIKRIVQYFRKRKDMRLRKWCVKLAAKTGTNYMYDTADQAYKFIKGLPESEK